MFALLSLSSLLGSRPKQTAANQTEKKKKTTRITRYRVSFWDHHQCQGTKINLQNINGIFAISKTTHHHKKKVPTTSTAQASNPQ
ncbi:hypothetical protein B0T19DRAFT_256703 [Cercophora scortea]|uniref:Secreted protein n=1 Tax=Cercophora scortea TaxID=314031 RepID=A0AAE0M6B3_9PEZI|nr:hypothetical protein B0T19DRAFT_256703 [Cercophora scortea]